MLGGGGLRFFLELFLSWCLSRLLALRKSKFTLTLSILPSILFLIFAKYQNFFPVSFFSSKLIFPIGISFYTLKIISCHIEIYRGKIEAPSLCDYILYVSLFTQILSGPVMRINDFIPQISASKFNSSEARLGAFMITTGLFKKLLVANIASEYVNKVHENISGVPSLGLWIGAFLYAFELYADFSGYSDISNGVMKILGIKLPANFNTPYFAHGFRDFWNRWHISFSSWLRDYIYIPLGGNKRSEFRRFMNVIITFIASGLWHGTGINFIVWGIAHGLLVYLSGKIKLLQNSLITFLLVVFLWVPFRAADMASVVEYYSGMFQGFEISFMAVKGALFNDYLWGLHASVLLSGIAVLVSYDLAQIRGKSWGAAFTFLFVSMIILFGRVGASPFIYAGF